MGKSGLIFDVKNKEFGKLRTVNKVQMPLREPALEIYRSIFPDCYVKQMRNNDDIEDVLDRDFGIDALLVLKDKSWFTLQEKYNARIILILHKKY
jgi:methyl coenzyme M reductase alpha subunit